MRYTHSSRSAKLRVVEAAEQWGSEGTGHKLVTKSKKAHQLSASDSLKILMTQAGLEPATPCSGGRCSNPLSYWANTVIFANLYSVCQLTKQ